MRGWAKSTGLITCIFFLSTGVLGTDPTHSPREKGATVHEFCTSYKLPLYLYMYPLKHILLMISIILTTNTGIGFQVALQNALQFPGSTNKHATHQKLGYDPLFENCCCVSYLPMCPRLLTVSALRTLAFSSYAGYQYTHTQSILISAVKWLSKSQILS